MLYILLQKLETQREKKIMHRTHKDTGVFDLCILALKGMCSHHRVKSFYDNLFNSDSTPASYLMLTNFLVSSLWTELF